MAKKIRVKNEFAGLIGLTASIGGGAVSLTGEDLKAKVPGTAGDPPSERVTKAATEIQLRQLFEEGCPLLEEIEDGSKTETKA